MGKRSTDTDCRGVGTIHGFYKGTPKIIIQRLQAIVACVAVPLVLQCGSVTPVCHPRLHPRGFLRRRFRAVYGIYLAAGSEGNRLMQYVAERREMVCYPEFRAKSWQIGSGPTEAECKTTTHRVKNRGRRWDTDNAEAMMALAALHDSRLWHQRWTTLASQRN